MRLNRVFRFLILPMALAFALGWDGCTYLRNVARQQQYEAEHKEQPGLWLSKHLLDRDTFFVYGRLMGELPAGGSHALAVAAFSSGYRKDEVVDVNYLGQSGTYYGMNLPKGKYRLMVLADLNDDGFYGRSEIVGFRRLKLEPDSMPDRVARDIDLTFEAPRELPLATLPLEAKTWSTASESLFYPRGTIRSLDDPIFDPSMSELGMYDPAAFTEVAPMTFYALEEDRNFKVPVIFVHGIGGSAREFGDIIARLDRNRYKPWFFHYPSGMDLDQLAALFNDIFLSGRLIRSSGMPVVIVAHSMGGLVVREALNHFHAEPGEANVVMFISAASPFGGIPSAALGVRYAPLVVPAWRELDPGSEFVSGLFRQPLPNSVEHHVLYAYRKPRDLEAPGGSDGVVPLTSQLPPDVRDRFASIEGFQTEHAMILHEPAAVERIVSRIATVHSMFPEDQMRYLVMGGFDVDLDARYGPLEQLAIHAYGHHLRALASDAFEVSHPLQRHFVAVMHGKAEPESPLESAWLKFRADFPEIANAAPTSGIDVD